MLRTESSDSPSMMTVERATAPNPRGVSPVA